MGERSQAESGASCLVHGCVGLGRVIHHAIHLPDKLGVFHKASTLEAPAGGRNLLDDEVFDDVGRGVLSDEPFVQFDVIGLVLGLEANDLSGVARGGEVGGGVGFPCGRDGPAWAFPVGAGFGYSK